MNIFHFDFVDAAHSVINGFDKYSLVKHVNYDYKGDSDGSESFYNIQIRRLSLSSFKLGRVHI